jgi:LEA14-like dessication related protein
MERRMRVPLSFLRPASLITAALMLGACAHLAQVVEQPEVRLTGLRLVSADLARQRYAIQLSVYNPNAFTVPLRDIAYQLELAGRPFASGTSDAGTRLPAREAVPIELTFETDLVRSAQNALEWLRRGESTLDYRLSGEVRVDVPGVRSFRFDRTGRVELER